MLSVSGNSKIASSSIVLFDSNLFCEIPTSYPKNDKLFRIIKVYEGIRYPHISEIVLWNISYIGHIDTVKVFVGWIFFRSVCLV